MEISCWPAPNSLIAASATMPCATGIYGLDHQVVVEVVPDRTVDRSVIVEVEREVFALDLAGEIPLVLERGFAPRCRDSRRVR
jgi:hypothetical protein